ncbi:hypothetical protein B0T14DRAFT_568253 [Immersiella caudata]|uniref:Uncharacterized protein n=1 Tax=Immersiella caudata TaxID=314043 RepID=A0AA39WJW7_9PEZI|nr:hypothetical protein B0T14DRAFT_568253 [Immersiella caudata]
MYLTRNIAGRGLPRGEDRQLAGLPAFYYLSWGGWSSPPDLLSALGTAANGSSSINDAFERGSLGLTKWMRDRAFCNDARREQSNSDQQLLTGSVSRVAVIFVAQWLFLAWPGPTRVLALIFVVLSVWETRSKQLPPCKSSSLVTLALGLDQDDKTDLREALVRKTVSATARRIKSRFRKRGTQPGLELSHTTGSGGHP